MTLVMVFLLTVPVMALAMLGLGLGVVLGRGPLRRCGACPACFDTVSLHVAFERHPSTMRMGLPSLQPRPQARQEPEAGSRSC
jgi:hypothetical protein